MNLIYNSEQYSVVEFGADRDHEALRFGGYEIMDKSGQREIYIDGPAAELFRNGQPVVMQVREREAPLARLRLSGIGDRELLGVGEEFRTVCRRLRVSVRVDDAGIAEQLRVVVQPHRPDIERQPVLFAGVERLLPWLRGEVTLCQRMRAARISVGKRAKDSARRILREVGGLDDEDIGFAAVRHGERQLIVVGRPRDELHVDHDVGVLVLELVDDMRHRDTVRPGEPIPKCQDRAAACVMQWMTRAGRAPTGRHDDERADQRCGRQCRDI